MPPRGRTCSDAEEDVGEADGGEDFGEGSEYDDTDAGEAGEDTPIRRAVKITQSGASFDWDLTADVDGAFAQRLNVNERTVPTPNTSVPAGAQHLPVTVC